MSRLRTRTAVVVLILGLLAACTGGGDDGASPSTTGDGGATTTVAPATTAPPVATTTTTPPLLARLAGVWVGGDPVQWARTTCLAAGDAAACADLPVQLSWQQELATCLRARGVDLALDPTRLVESGPRLDPARTAPAWEACRPIAVRGLAFAAEVVDSSLWVPDCLATKGWIWLLHVQFDPAARTDLAQCDAGVALRACMRDNGADLGDPAVTGVRALYAPAVAQAVWAACRDLAMRVSYQAWRGDVALGFADCMAPRGWLVEDYTRASGAPIERYIVDRDACAVPSAYEQYAACMRANGIESAAVDIDAPNAPPLLVRAVEDATRAWTACRGLWLASQAGPDLVPSTLFARFPDCMAGLGWLVEVRYGAVEDMAAYERATATCNEPRNGGAPTRSSTLPAFASRSDWVACFRAANVAVAADRAASSTTRQVFAGAAVTDAYVACATRWTGVPAGIFQTCAANRGVVPGLGGLGTWDVVDACGLARWSLTARQVTPARRSFLSCLVEQGSTTEPVLHTFDVVIAAWESCTAKDPAAAGDTTIVMYDRTEADLATLRYWACLADHGLRVPDPRRAEPVPTLAGAREAIAACKDRAVVVRTPQPTYGD